MRKISSNTVCPVEGSVGLDNKLRRLFQNPTKILKPYISPDMSVMDFGCGPGFFTIDIARMLGDKGKVTAVDLQQGMLDKLSKKIKATCLEKKIRLHKCEEKSIHLTDTFDFILAFYMIHEVPDQGALFTEFKSLLKDNGKILIVEPKFHVPQQKFDQMEEKIREIGFDITDGPKLPFSRSLLLKNR